MHAKNPFELIPQDLILYNVLSFLYFHEIKDLVRSSALSLLLSSLTKKSVSQEELEKELDNYTKCIFSHSSSFHFSGTHNILQFVSVIPKLFYFSCFNVRSNTMNALAGAIEKHADSLQTISLVLNEIEEVCAQRIGQALENMDSLTVLTINLNDMKGKQFIERGLEKISSLQVLDLSWCEMQQSEPVQKWLQHSLRVLNLSNNKIRNEKFNGALTFNSVLQVLDLNNNQMNVKEIANSLQYNSCLRSLNLGRNIVGDCGSEAIAAMLKNNSCLKTLNLNTNRIQVESIASALEHNSSLQSLDLSHCTIERDGAKAIGKMLKTNRSLTLLNLSCVSGAASLQIKEKRDYIFTGLKNNSSLRVLDLSYTQITLTKIVKLKHNSCLQVLRLRGNTIGPKECEHIAKLLQTNSHLQLLDLSYNVIKDAGAKRIAKSLRFNSCLKTLNLQSNVIGEAGCVLCVRLLKIDSVLQELNLANNNTKD